MTDRHIFITVHDGDIEKNYLRSSVLHRLKQAGLRIVLLVREHADYYRKEFGDNQTLVEILPPALGRLEMLFFYVGWNSLPTNSVRLRRYDLYLRHRSLFRYLIEMSFGFWGRYRLWRQLLRSVYNLIPDRYAEELLERYRPILVFTPSMFSAYDARLLRAARRRGIPTVTAAKSWDVLTTKAFTRVLADRILVPNRHAAREALELGDYPEERIRIVGLPQFDLYTDLRVLLPREEFCRRLGADPRKKIILYAAPGDWKNPYDFEVLEGLHDAVIGGRIASPATVLVRFHPKYPHRVEGKKQRLYGFIFDRPGTYFSHREIDSIEAALGRALDWTFMDQDIAHLANSLYHSAVVINTESTMTLDAAAFNRPVVLVAYDGRRLLRYHESVRRNYDREHYQYVLRTEGARLATSEDELIREVNAYLADPDRDAAGRQRLRDELLYRVDGRAGERIADAILELALTSKANPLSQEYASQPR